MRPSRRPIIVATRRSMLAQAQARAVAQALARLNPGTEVKLLPLATEGDRHSRQHPTAAPAGKGMFTAGVEAALLDERADVAVHSLKDMPTRLTPGLVIAAIPKRGDPRDCLIAREADRIEALAEGATFGTSSMRRASQVLRARPDLTPAPLRGNIETRLGKVHETREVDATLLAMAGLQRGGLAAHATRPIDPSIVLPSPGQAALAIQCRADDHVTLRRCLPLNDTATATCVEAERHVASELGGDCRTPLAALAESVGGDRLRLRARVLSHDGTECIEADEAAGSKQARKLAGRVVELLLRQGAEAVLAASRAGRAG